ncbi:MAG: hypothetical protein ACRC6M_08065 [Microcystaceae cyanobacterium]
MSDTLDQLCTNLENLDPADSLEGAIFREQAQDVLANPEITIPDKTAIADSLMQANQQLVTKTVGKEDSY